MTRYCSGVSFFFSSSSDVFLLVSVDDGLVIGVGDAAGSSFFRAPAWFKKIRIPLSATKTIAQKASIAREDLCGRCGNWITGKNVRVSARSTMDFACNHAVKGAKSQIPSPGNFQISNP